jgi:SAM-dependent methyltransferase
VTVAAPATTEAAGDGPGGRTGGDRRDVIRNHADYFAARRDWWIRRSDYFHQSDLGYLRFLVPEGARVLDLGCGTGNVLAGLGAALGVGVDFAERVIEAARANHPQLSFVCANAEDPTALAGLDGAPFDVILLSDTIGSLQDCQTTFEALHDLCHRDTRLIVSYYSYLWEPVLRLAEWLGLKMPQAAQNYLTMADISNLLTLSGFEVVKQERRMLIPRRLLGLGTLINRYLAPLPMIRRLCLRNYTVVRSLRHAPYTEASATVVIPCRNERGNIEAAIQRMPAICPDLEIIFVEGHSSDGTKEEIERVIAAHGGEHDIKLLVQDGVGKGDAVRRAFDHARGDILMILDADLTVAPEDLPKFYLAIVSGRGELVNGSRLVYPMEKQAMRFLNLVGNAVFAWLFSWLLNQRITDTLCGTKALTRAHYRRIAQGRDYFGDFDPFGDFDLIFGASKLNLKIIDIPVSYGSRSYGETQISRFQHGLLLLRMFWFAFRKLKSI